MFEVCVSVRSWSEIEDREARPELVVQRERGLYAKAVKVVHATHEGESVWLIAAPEESVSLEGGRNRGGRTVRGRQTLRVDPFVWAARSPLLVQE